MNIRFGFSSQDDDLYRLALLATALPSEGTLSGWKTRVSKQCVGHPGLTLAVSSAFTSPFLGLFNFPSDGFHFFGGVPGEAAAYIDVAASVWGSSKLVRRWGHRHDNATGPDVWAGIYLLECLDSASPDSVAQVLKGKSIQAAENSMCNTFKPALFISAGLGSFEQCRQGGDLNTWQQSSAVMFDIPVEHLRQGASEDNSADDRHVTLADFISARADECYGSAIAAFMPLVSELGAAKVKAILDHHAKAFLDRTSYDSAVDEVRLAISYLALVASVGELATALNVTGWSEGQALDAAYTCFEAWEKNRTAALTH